MLLERALEVGGRGGEVSERVKCAEDISSSHRY
jgi:hypothetical protein